MDHSTRDELEIVFPLLSEDYISILEDISMGEMREEDLKEVKSFLEPLIEEIRENLG